MEKNSFSRLKILEMKRVYSVEKRCFQSKYSVKPFSGLKFAFFVYLETKGNLNWNVLIRRFHVFIFQPNYLSTGKLVRNILVTQFICFAVYVGYHADAFYIMHITHVTPVDTKIVHIFRSAVF